MMNGGYRVGAGRPKGSLGKKKLEKPVAPVKGVGKLEIFSDAKSEGLDPLTYMLRVMNDMSADELRRDRMSISAAPYCHARADTVVGGKKEERASLAKEAEKSFPVPSGPRLVASQ